MKLNISIGLLELLYLVGARIKINDGAATITIFDAAMIVPALIRHFMIASRLRRKWSDFRLFDRELGNHPVRFFESYLCIRYQARLLFGAKWFERQC